jgi:7-cyano-7-deazaguanine synthase in queuosine biosynthesis
MNPLTKTVLNMATKAAFSSGAPATFAGPYRSPALVKLANYLLQKEGNSVRLQQEPARKALGDAGSVVLFSGGIFSYATLLHELFLGRKVLALHFDRGPAADLTWHLAAAWHAATGKEEPSEPLVADLRLAYEKSPEAELEVRFLTWEEQVHPALARLYMVSEAAAYAAELGASKVVLGTHAYTHDARFCREVSSILTEVYGSRIRVDSPYNTDRPEHAICRHLDLGFDKETLIQESFSCEKSSTLQPQCGACWGCYSRWKVFLELGWLEKHFEVLPPDTEDYERYAQRWDKLVR